MNKENNTYTVADFAKYYKGTMSFAEMHALENAALDDPFLADALEGYATTQSAENDLSSLKKRLLNYNGKAKVLSGSSFIHTTWLRIAALLIIMLGVGYFFYNKYDDNETTIAQNKTSATDTLQIAEAKTTSITPITETTTSTEKPAATGTVEEEKLRNDTEESLLENNIEKKAKQLETAEITAPTFAQTDNVQTAEDKRSLTADIKQLNNTQNYSRYYTQQGNVTDLKGGPLQNVSIKDRNSNYRTVTDVKGKFSLKTTDSNAYVSVTSVGFESKEVLLNNNTQKKITLDKQPTNLQEVVVVGYATKRKKSEIGTASDKGRTQELSGKVAGLNVQSSKATPASVKATKANTAMVNSDNYTINVLAFNEYVKNNIIPLFDDDNIPQKGIVRLVFFIDKEGKPQNIEVIYSSCKNCNAQAIMLLKNGPTWVSGLLQTKYVEITF
ncbi:MAG: carboxypeptidase-like regulatory domain-containing protein [Ferruginibacter sp.]|nr:carboxypeptidase-like regulatory domain-containing protein [Ferruginibacter sp.]